MNAPPSIDELYQREKLALVVTRTPAVIGLFVIVFSFAWIFEYLSHPERMRIYFQTFSVELLVCVVTVLALRTAAGRPHAITIVSSCCVAIFALIASYHIRLGGETEIMAIALMFVVTGMTVGLPLGAKGQLPIAAAAVIAYLAAYVGGAHSVVSVPMVTLGMVSVGGLSAAGSAFLDHYRFTAFQRTEELREANAALAQANQAKNLFLANISHELRTPLNVIVGYTGLMLSEEFGALSPVMRESLERVMINAEGLVHLIGDLLDLSRIEAGQLALRRETIELTPLFAEISSVAAQLLVDKPVRFHAEECDGVRVDGDRERLRQVLINLLSNAGKFTPSGEIRLRTIRNGGRVIIEMSDTGIGIHEADLAHIFEPFRRAENAKEYGGVGVGLSISNRLVREMGGSLTATSTPDLGSTFRIQLREAHARAAE